MDTDNSKTKSDSYNIHAYILDKNQSRVLADIWKQGVQIEVS